MPRGSSPIVPDGCAPTGLKYRRHAIATLGSAMEKSLKMSSAMYLVCGVADVSCVSEGRTRVELARGKDSAAAPPTHLAVGVGDAHADGRGLGEGRLRSAVDSRARGEDELLDAAAGGRG